MQHLTGESTLMKVEIGLYFVKLLFHILYIRYVNEGGREKALNSQSFFKVRFGEPSESIFLKIYRVLLIIFCTGSLLSVQALLQLPCAGFSLQEGWGGAFVVVAEHLLWDFAGCSLAVAPGSTAQAQLIVAAHEFSCPSIWNPPRSEIESMSPASAGGFFTTEPQISP